MRNLRVHVIAAIAMAAALLWPVAAAADTTTSTKYGLASSIQEGNILHCFDWTYAQITEELEAIAEAGFTTVQTSPAQYPGGSGSWYWLYQPLGFYLPDEGPLGTKEELETLCTEAHKLGIFIIVDVVANHLAGDHTNIQDDLKDSKYWHTYGSDIDYTYRYAVTHGDIGMTDLATENTYVQGCVQSYLKELLAVGVDGFRWDAAKHISLPSEDGENSQFWPAVTTSLGEKTLLGNEPWHYGEILDGPSSSSSDYYLLGEYADYIAFTDNAYGNGIRSSFNNSTAPSGYGNLVASYSSYVEDKDVVYWCESHDTYCNGGESSSVGTNIIDRTWAVVGSRNGIPALYLSRPFETDNDAIQMAEKGSTHFTATEVAAVNHFHNATAGQADYFVSENNANAICRKNGAVVVLGSGSNTSVSITNGDSYTTAGTYTDEISGNTFTVTSSTISGTVGSTGIAVFYTDERPTITFSPEEGAFTDETLTITATMSNATSGTIAVGTTTYTLSSSSNTATFTIGSDMSYGESIDITWTASSSSETVTGTETYTKKDPDDVVYVYYNNPNSWSTVYIYIYDDSGNEVASWPGETMTKNASLTLDAYPDQTGWWVYEVPDGFEYGYVIFNNGSGGDGNQYPTSDGLELDGESMICYGTTWSDTDGTVTETDNSVTLYVWPTSDTTPAPHLYAWIPDTETALNGTFDNAPVMSTQQTLGGKTFYTKTFDGYDEVDYIFWNTYGELVASSDAIPSSSGIDIYVQCSQQPYIHAWTSSGNITSGTPVAMNATGVSNLYYYSFASSYTSVNFLLTSAEGAWTNQTSNITSVTKDSWYGYEGTSSSYWSVTASSTKAQTYDLTADGSKYISYTSPSSYTICGDIEEGIYPATTTPFFCYVVNTDKWSKPYIWAWNSSGGNYTGGTWAGELLTNVVDTYSYKGTDYDVYKWTYSGSESDYPDYLILSNNGNSQSASLVFVNGGYYDTDGNLLGIDKVIFDQNTQNGNYDESDVTLRLIRTLSSSYWNSFCLPIDLSADDIAAYFGDGCGLEQFTKQEGIYFYSSEVSEILAGDPYLIRPTATVTNPEFEGVTMSNTANDTLTIGATDYKVAGVYSPTMLNTNKTHYFLSTHGTLQYSNGDGTPLYGMRFYLIFPSGENNGAAMSTIFGYEDPDADTGTDDGDVDTDIDDDTLTDGIDEVTTADSNAYTIYSIDGRALGNDSRLLTKGIYIMNGKKIIVK